PRAVVPSRVPTLLVGVLGARRDVCSDRARGGRHDARDERRGIAALALPVRLPGAHADAELAALDRRLRVLRADRARTRVPPALAGRGGYRGGDRRLRVAAFPAGTLPELI